MVLWFPGGWLSTYFKYLIQHNSSTRQHVTGACVRGLLVFSCKMYIRQRGGLLKWRTILCPSRFTVLGFYPFDIEVKFNVTYCQAPLGPLTFIFITLCSPPGPSSFFPLLELLSLSSFLLHFYEALNWLWLVPWMWVTLERLFHVPEVVSGWEP